MKPKISIITINHNNLEGLKKTVESVKNQTYQEFEYIVIDGGSNDGSLEVLKQNKGLFDFWLSEPDKGVYQAMNKGIKKATGKYVLFLNSGDHFIGNKALENSYKELTDESIVYFNLQVVDNEKAFIKEYPDKLSFSYFVNDTLPHPATFIKKDIFFNTHFYREDFKIVSDWKFFMDAICKYNVTYKHINKPISTFYIGGMSSKPKNRIVKQKEKSTVLKEEYSVYTQDLDDVIAFRDTLNSLRASRIIKILVKLGFLNEF